MKIAICCVLHYKGNTILYYFVNDCCFATCPRIISTYLQQEVYYDFTTFKSENIKIYNNNSNASSELVCGL